MSKLGRYDYYVTDAEGNTVQPNQEILDFRGDPAYFRGVSRPAGPGYQAKVLSSRDPEGDQWSEQENYASVFDLTVTPSEA